MRSIWEQLTGGDLGASQRVEPWADGGRLWDSGVVLGVVRV